MGWQKTFTLAKRGKGCHLVTDEIAQHLESGLRGVQVCLYGLLATKLDVHSDIDGVIVDMMLICLVACV